MTGDLDVDTQLVVFVHTLLAMPHVYMSLLLVHVLYVLILLLTMNFALFKELIYDITKHLLIPSTQYAVLQHLALVLLLFSFNFS